MIYCALKWYNEYLVYPEQMKTETAIWNSMTWPEITLDIEILCSTCQVCQMTKYEPVSKKCDLLPLKLQNLTLYPWIMVCVDLVGSCTIRTIYKTQFMLEINHERSINKTQADLKILKPKISQKYPSRICFITPSGDVTRNLNLLSLTIRLWANSNVS
jgi:hypothetical protein